MKRKKVLVYGLLIVSLGFYTFAFVSKWDNQMLGMLLGGLAIFPAGIFYMLWLFKMPGRNWSEEKKEAVQETRNRQMKERYNRRSIFALLLILWGIVSYFWWDAIENFWNQQGGSIVMIIACSLIGVIGVIWVIWIIKWIRNVIVEIIAEAIKKSKED